MRRPALLTVVVALGVAAPGAGLASCGGASPSHHPASTGAGAPHPGASTPAAPSDAGDAKRRYLAHFRGDCRSAGRLGKATGNLIGSLSAQIAHGNLAAVAELNLFLQRLAATYQAGLRGTRALGTPPGPDSNDGRAYLDDTQRMIADIQDMGAAVGRLDAHGLARAAARLHATTAAAGTAAKRYGFPTCRSGSSGAPPPPSVTAGAPV